MTKQRAQRGLLHGLALGTLALGSLGCGTTDLATTGGSSESRTHSATAECLEAVGAERATGVSDIGFFQRARAKGDADNSGIALRKDERLVVDVWTGAADASGRNPWILWAAQPWDTYVTDRLSVETLARESHPRSFVVFATSPSTELMARADACFGDQAATPAP